MTTAAQALAQRHYSEAMDRKIWAQRALRHARRDGDTMGERAAQQRLAIASRALQAAYAEIEAAR